LIEANVSERSIVDSAFQSLTMYPVKIEVTSDTVSMKFMR